MNPQYGSAVSLIDLLRILIRARRLIVACTLAVVLPAAVVALLFPSYHADSQFVPQKSSGRPNLAGLAAQFGFMLPGVAEEESPDFYATLIQSRELLGDVVRARYRLAGPGGELDTATTELITIYSIEHDEPQGVLLKATDVLRDHLKVSRDLRTGIVTVRTVARWPQLAEAINRQVLTSVNDFNLRKRQSRAASEREFVDGRLAQARVELEEAEGELRRFLEQNRYRNSPRLLFEAERLERRVDLRQQVYVTLAQALEQARIDEVRNTPVITVVDSPEGSAERSPTLLRNVVVGTLVGLVMGILLALVRVYLDEQRRVRPAEMKDLEGLVHGVMPQPLWRLLNRL